MAKRIISIFVLICTLLCVFASCGGSNDGFPNNNGNSDTDGNDEVLNDNQNNNTDSGANSNNGQAIPPSAKYEIKSIGAYHDGLAVISTTNGYGYIDTKGNVVIEPVYESADDFNTLALVKLNGKKQYINKKGETVYTATGKETKIGEFCNGFFWIESKEEAISGTVYSLTYYDEFGNIAFTCQNTQELYRNVPIYNMGADVKKSMSSFNEYGYAPTEHGFVDRKGRYVEFSGLGKKFNITNVQNNYVLVDDIYLYYIDFETLTATYLTYFSMPPRYELTIDYLGNGYYAEYYRGTKKTYIDISTTYQNAILSFEYIDELGGASVRAVNYYADHSGEDFITLYLESSSGVFFSTIIDMDGDIILSPTKNISLGKLIYKGNGVIEQYNEKVYQCYSFSSGVCIAQDSQSGLYGYINTDGDWVIEAQFQNVTDFYGEGDNAVAVVNKNTVINRNGDIIFTIEKN